jgi:TolB-like protein/class 3 adenylate cyclase
MASTRRLAAILAADVAGYSRLMGADEEETLECLKAHRRQLVDPKIKEHRGRIVKTTGDGILVEFSSIVDAVGCAAELQRAMVDRNGDTPADKRITFRVGINLGDIIVDGDDIYGNGVNIAARLEALAEPGGICISRTVRDHIGDRLPYRFEDMGEQSVKNIAHPVHTYAMSAAAIASLPEAAARLQPSSARRARGTRVAGLIKAGIAGWRARSTERPSNSRPIASPGEVGKPSAPFTAPRLSIVVLPFENLSNDPDQEYFADGITDDLTTDLSRISASFVIARNTAFTYKGKPVDVKQIGRELGVRYVLEGSVRRANDQVRVNVQLIDAESGAHVWADRFETDRRNLAEAQSEITGRLARTLNLELVEDAGRRIEQEKAVDPDAQDLVMRGWASWNRPRSAASHKEAQQAFERALEVDPGSIDARIGIARVLVENLVQGWSNSFDQDSARAELLLLEALERHTRLSPAHSTMGLLRRVQNRLPEARVEFETAIALGADDEFAHGQLGWTLLFLGLPDAGLIEGEKALRLSLHGPDRWGTYLQLGWCQLLLSQMDPAIDLLIKSHAANSRPWVIHFGLAAALGLKDDLDGAKTALAESLKLNPEVNSLARFRVYRPWGNPEYWALFEKTVAAGLRRVSFPNQ